MAYSRYSGLAGDSVLSEPRKPRIQPVLLAFALLLPLAIVCLGAGRLAISPFNIAGILSHAIFGLPSVDTASSVVWAPFEEAVVLNVRLPRILMALLVGAALSVAGASFQGLFANPLATPDTLGVGAGASFGAALGILLGGNHLVIQFCALVFGLGAMGLTWLISNTKENRSILMVVLSGTITGAFFQALISLVKYVADPETKLPAITYWLLGSIADVSYSNILVGAPLMILGVALILAMCWRLNVLSLSDDEAASLGIHVQRARWTVILAATAVTASAVSLCGQIGWVGLVVPHISRILVGSDHRKMIPMSIALGAAYLLLVDTVARSATAAEIPLSILTALVGAPFFAYLLRRSKGGAWN